MSKMNGINRNKMDFIPDITMFRDSFLGNAVVLRGG